MNQLLTERPCDASKQKMGPPRGTRGHGGRPRLGEGRGEVSGRHLGIRQQRRRPSWVAGHVTWPVPARERPKQAARARPDWPGKAGGKTPAKEHCQNKAQAFPRRQHARPTQKRPKLSLSNTPRRPPGPGGSPPARGDRNAPSGSPRGAALRRDVRRGRSTRRPRPGASPSAPGRGPSRASRPSLTLANVVRVPPGPPGASRGFFASLDVSPFLSFGVAEKTAAASALLPSSLSLSLSFLLLLLFVSFLRCFKQPNCSAEIGRIFIPALTLPVQPVLCPFCL